MRPGVAAFLPAVLTPALLFCQASTPAHWRYAPAEPAMLLGLDWRQASKSNLSPLATALLWSEAPGLDFAEEFGGVLVVVEPGAGRGNFLAIVSGRFNLVKLRRAAAAEGAKPGRYRGVEVFSAGGTDAVIADQYTLLVGDTASVRAALDRGGVPTPKGSVIWLRAGELSSAYPIWFASSSLKAIPGAEPKPGSIFADVQSLDGGLSLIRGLDLTLDMTTSAEQSAAALAGAIQRELLTAASPVLREISVRAEGLKVRISASVDLARLDSGLKTAFAGARTSREGLMDWVVRGNQTAPTVALAVTPKVSEPPPEKRTIRIVGLEEGTREIPYPSQQR